MTARYTEALHKRIIKLVKNGTLVNEICKMKGMPNREQFNSWKEQHIQFNEDYREAVKLTTDDLLEELAKIDKTDRKLLYNDCVMSIRLQCEKDNTPYDSSCVKKLFELECKGLTEKRSGIQWRLMKLDPERFSDRTIQEINWSEKVKDLNMEDLKDRMKKVLENQTVVKFTGGKQ